MANCRPGGGHGSRYLAFRFLFLAVSSSPCSRQVALREQIVGAHLNAIATCLSADQRHESKREVRSERKIIGPSSSSAFLRCPIDTATFQPSLILRGGCSSTSLEDIAWRNGNSPAGCLRVMAAPMARRPAAIAEAASRNPSRIRRTRILGIPQDGLAVAILLPACQFAFHGYAGTPLLGADRRASLRLAVKFGSSLLGRRREKTLLLHPFTISETCSGVRVAPAVATVVSALKRRCSGRRRICPRSARIDAAVYELRQLTDVFLQLSLSHAALLFPSGTRLSSTSLKNIAAVRQRR